MIGMSISMVFCLPTELLYRSLLTPHHLKLCIVGMVCNSMTLLFFLYLLCVFFRKPVLPIEPELLGDLKNDSDEDTDLENYIRKTNDLKRRIYRRVDKNIKISQNRQKKDYDMKLKKTNVCVYSNIVLIHYWKC